MFWSPVSYGPGASGTRHLCIFGYRTPCVYSRCGAARKVFFFEKKKQKTFALWLTWPVLKLAAYAREQKFFASFFKKEDVSYFANG
jgi:hypothetical protein